MPEEKEDGLPAVTVPDTPPPEQKKDELPDQTPGEVDVQKLKADYEKEKSELAEQLKKAAEEKAALEKRVKDNQEYISRTRNVEKVIEKPSKTFEQYEQEVLTEFENDPKAGLRRVLRDVAFDRDLERREMERKLAEAEEKAFKRVIALDPEKSKVVEEVQKLDEEHPTLSGLTFDQKLEIVKLKGATVPHGTKTQERVSREQDMLSDVGGSRFSGKSDRTPGWVNDPEVLREAKGHFKSKQEMLDWANPEKAKLMGMKMRPQ